VFKRVSSPLFSMHLKCDPLADVRSRSQRVEAMLRLAVPSVASFESIARARQQLVIKTH
jgi:hypothetical protein